MKKFKAVWLAFFKTPMGSALNVALYIAGSNLVALLIDSLAKLDLDGKSLWYVILVGVLNVVAVAIKKFYFVKK